VDGNVELLGVMFIAYGRLGRVVIGHKQLVRRGLLVLLVSSFWGKGESTEVTFI